MTTLLAFKQHKRHHRLQGNFFRGIKENRKTNKVVKLS